MPYTEFYCDASTGSNINAGDDKTVSTTTNGAYTRAGGAGGTDLFVAASGTPFSTASVGDFVSVYADGATVTTFTGRITAVNGGGASIDISLTAIAGTRPATAGTGNTATIGGKWKGPNGTSSFPFSHVAGTLTNASGDITRVNMKNTSSYSVTAAMTHSTNGPLIWEGYTTAPGDGGLAIIDGGTSGAAYTLLTISGTDNGWLNIIFQNNGLTSGGSGTQGVSTTGSRSWFFGCVFKGFRGAGSYSASSQCHFTECEAYDCNKSNVTSRAGFYAATSGSYFRRCRSHHNTGGASAHGFGLDQSMSAIDCVSHDNTGDGFYCQADQYIVLDGCDAYNNTGHGFNSTAASNTLVFNIQNSNFVKNGGYGIRSNSLIRSGLILNCGFGSGTFANASGDIIPGLTCIIRDKVTFAVNTSPYVDASSGDFRINLAAAKGTGRGTFLNTQTGSSDSFVSYPDIGAGQHQPSAGGGGSNNIVICR